jgi:uncharacterized membrane protein YphA (DoxX/SURF4 family)
MIAHGLNSSATNDLENTMSDVSNLSRLNKPEPRISSATERRMFSSLNKARRLHAAGWAPIPLRLVVGYGFMAHGYVKLMKGPDVFVGILHALGVPAPHVMAWLTILVELLGGLAVLLGAFVPLVSLPMAAVLLVAMCTVHLPYGFTSNPSGRAAHRTCDKFGGAKGTLMAFLC